MRAMELQAIGGPLRHVEREVPRPGPGELLIEISACGVCRTDLHIIDGDIRDHLPVVPGHEIVGRIVEKGPDTPGVSIGDRVGVPWLGRTCGQCRYCRAGQENLCDDPLFTGFNRNGGFASHCIANTAFCFSIPGQFSDAEATPLLCAGLIGYRSLRLAGNPRRLGLYGFGAAAHILTQVALWQGREVYAFTRPGDTDGQTFARALGCVWAGGSDQAAPQELDAAIIFAPVGALVPLALRAVHKGGRLVCGGIHMSDIPAFPYADLWGERALLSVANLTRADGEEFLRIAAEIPVETRTHDFPLEQANEAVAAVRAGALQGAAVLIPPS
ncbi:zinc-dependent alcohol dehydrogenase family protein [Allosphingosinicella flava]